MRERRAVADDPGVVVLDKHLRRQKLGRRQTRIPDRGVIEACSSLAPPAARAAVSMLVDLH